MKHLHENIDRRNTSKCTHSVYFGSQWMLGPFSVVEQANFRYSATVELCSNEVFGYRLQQGHDSFQISFGVLIFWLPYTFLGVVQSICQPIQNIKI